MPVTPIPLNQPPKNVVLALINRDNNTSFTLGQIDFDSITPMPSSFARNTRVRVFALPDGGFSESEKFVYYDRLDLGYQWRNTIAVAPVDNAESTHDILEAMNNLYNLFITPDDVVNVPIITNPHPVTASAGSWVWVGEVDVNIVPVTGENLLPLSEEFEGLSSPGFTYSSSADYDKQTSQLVYEMLAELNGRATPYNPGHFELSQLTQLTPPLVGITLTSVTGSGFSGEYSFTYPRIPLSMFFPTGEIPLSVFTGEGYVIGEPIDSAFIKAYINTVKGLSFNDEELAVPDIMLLPDSSFLVSSTLANYLVYGSVTLTIIDDTGP